VIDGRPTVVEHNVIDQYTYRLPSLDVRSIACGGGSIAWFDEATGGLRVGPASAGSEPGPASYGGGGAEPTVTDADVVLGLRLLLCWLVIPLRMRILLTRLL